MAQYLSPGHYVVERAPETPTIAGTSISTVGLVGVCQKGPIGKPTLITNWTEFVNVFGGLYDKGWVGYAAYLIFQNANGARIYVVRTAHYTNIDDASTLVAKKATITIKDRNTTAANTLKVEAANEGTWGNALKIVIANGSTTTSFNLTVLETVNGVDYTREQYTDLNLDATSSNYVETVINNQSKYITVTNMFSSSPSPNNLPAVGTYQLAGGNDGLTGITDTDYVGSATSKTGLYAFDTIDDGLILAIPGIATSTVHNGLLNYATQRGDSFAVLDSPFGLSASDIVNYVIKTANLNSSYGAIWWPNVKITDPLTGLAKVVPASGAVIGAMVRTDNTTFKGVYKVPAGVEDGKLYGVIDVETSEVNEKAKRDVVYPNRINPIAVFSGYGVLAYGARTLDATGQMPYINERRTMMYCEKSIVRGTQWVEFENNDERLWGRIVRSITGFLLTVWNEGGLKGSTPDEAFFVKCDAETNPPENIERGILTARIGLALQKPAEFIVFEFSQKTQASQ